MSAGVVVESHPAGLAPDWLETDRAAAILGLPRQSVSALAYRGEVRACKVGRTWLLERESVEEYLRDRRGRVGRPRGSRSAGLDAAPLVELVEARGGFGACGVQEPGDEVAYYRARRDGRLSVSVADRLAVRVLSLTMMEVWGEIEPTDDVGEV